MSSHKTRFVLLDRDGVINRRIHNGYVTSWRQFEFLPRSREALRLLAEHGYSVLVVSNQACVGNGLLSSHDLETITRRFLLEVALSGGNITRVYYCRHKKDDRCNCRKPRPGLIFRARAEHEFIPEETFFIGDSPSDIAAAQNAGCPSVLLRREAFLDLPAHRDPPLVACNLYQAVELILALHHFGRDSHALAPFELHPATL